MAFVPSTLDATNWESLQPLYEDLVQRSVDTVTGLEELIRDESELREWVSEAGSRLSEVPISLHDAGGASYGSGGRGS